MAQISRLKSAEISNGNAINADDIEAELDQLVSAHNTNDTVQTSITTGTYTFAGAKTFSTSPLMNGIEERTAGSGVTLDTSAGSGVLVKDGTVQVVAAPLASAGCIGYASNQFQGYRNGATKNFLMTGDVAVISAVNSRSSNTILGTADSGALFVCTSTFTQTITAAATLGSLWYCFIRNDGTGIITLDPNASETIDGNTTIKVYPGEAFTLVCDGSNFKTIGRQRGLILIQRQTASSSATIDFTTGLDDAEFDEFEFRIQHLVPATDATAAWLRISTDAGSSWKSAGTDYTYAGTYDDSAGGASTAVNSTGAGQIVISYGALCGNATGEAFSANIKVPILSNSAIYKTFNVTGGGQNSTPRAANVRVSGQYMAVTAINGVRFLQSAGNITSGTFEVWGLRK